MAAKRISPERSRRAALLAATLLAAAAPASAQLVAGKVVDDGTDQPIAGATIELRDTIGGRSATGVADTAGEFRILVPQPGGYRLLVSHIAYTTAETISVQVAFGQQVRVELRMSPTAVVLEPLRVVGRSSFNAGWLQEFYDRAVMTRRSGVGRVFFRDEVARSGMPVASNFLVYLMPRGGCQPTIFLDGLEMNDARHLDSVIQPDLIEGVELYNNQAFLPDRYANRGHCAIAMFWTRRDLVGARPLSWRRVLVAGGIIAGILLLFQF